MTQALLSDFDRELEDVKRQRAYIEQLRGQKAPEGRMVGNTYIRPSWAEQLGPIVQELAGMYHEKDVNKREADVSQRMQQGATDWMSQRPQAQQRELQGPQPEGVGGPVGYQTVQPTMQQNLDWAQKGQANPLTRALAAQYGSDVLVKEPERQENREFRASEAQKQRDLQQAQYADQLAFKKDQLERELKRSDLDRASREALTREHQQTLLAIAGMSAGNRDRFELVTDNEGKVTRVNKDTGEVMGLGDIGRGDKATGAGKGKRDPVQDAKEINNLLDQAEEHIKKGTSSYIGYGADQVARAFGASTSGSRATAALGTIGPQIVSKMPRLEGPQSDADRKLYERAAGKLDDPTIPVRDKQAALAQMREINKNYANGPYYPPGYQRPDTGATGTWNNAPPVGTVKGGHRFKGGDPALPANWEKQ